MRGPAGNPYVASTAGEPPRSRDRSVWIIAIALLLIWPANLVFTLLCDLLR